MAEEMSQEQMLQAQKENCIFCKIIAGQIPSRKVFEDEHMIAVLDINPATKGHLLVIPKEHYPILPVIPFPVMQHIFKKVKSISSAVKEALLAKAVTVFIANGGVAGQQSPHFLFHLIPHDTPLLEIPFSGDKTANNSLGPALSQRLTGLMQAYAHEVGQGQVLVPQEIKSEVVEPDTEITEERLNKLIEIINTNADLKEAIIERPDEVKEAAKTNEKWKELFAGIDIDQLSNNLKIMGAAKVKEKTEKKEGADLDKVSGLFQ